MKLGSKIPSTEFIIGHNNTDEQIMSLRNWSFYKAAVAYMKPALRDPRAKEVFKMIEEENLMGATEEIAFITDRENSQCITIGLDNNIHGENLSQIAWLYRHLISLRQLLDEIEPQCFLNYNDDLVSLILQDKDVRYKLGVPIEEMERWLQDLTDFIDKGRRFGQRDYRYNRQTLSVFNKRKPMILSPWPPLPGCHTALSPTIEVTNTNNGKKIKTSPGHPELIKYYGFHLGETAHRNSPTDLVKVFCDK